MKKIVAFTLLLCMVLSFTACTDDGSKTSDNTNTQDTTSNDTELKLTMREIYDAAKTEALLKNHASVQIRDEMDGELWREMYLTKDYYYDYIPSEESDWAEFMTDDECYCYMGGGYLRYLPISPDGISDFTSYRADHYAEVVLGEDALGDTIESVTQKDGRITVKSVCDQEILEAFDLTYAKFEYVLDAKTREMISVISDYTYNDGSAFNAIKKVTYDAEAPEILKEFLGYANQTENLRNITVVSNPGTEKEVSQSVQVAKGLVVGFRYEEETYVFEVYTDAACTEAYDPYADTDSDQTVYVKWTNA